MLYSVAKSLGVKFVYLEKMSRQASHLYKTYQIAKKTGGMRTIHHPARHLKVIQREIVRQVFSKYPVHDSVYSYRKDVSTFNLAYHHAGSRFLSRFDFAKFFESISKENIENLMMSDSCQQIVPIPLDQIRMIAKLVTRHQFLTIGAPSSPSISNCILFNFDLACYNYCKKNNVRYTRYADDIYLSSDVPNQLEKVSSYLIVNLLKTAIPTLSLNREKSIMTSKKRKMEVTGLVLTPEGGISVGRDKKRMVRAMIHHLKYASLSVEDFEKLKGYLSYLKSIEPTYIESLKKKYSAELARLCSF